MIHASFSTISTSAPAAARSCRAPARNGWRPCACQALCDGILDASILTVYEGRYRKPDMHEPKWLELQAGKVSRALAVLEAAPPPVDPMPNVGQITLACALSYRDFRFNGDWRGEHPRLVAWLDDFAARVPAFAATKPE